MITCPFCHEDQSQIHADTLRTGVNFIKMAACLCTECGEPVIILPTGFRKPTDDEYVTLHSDDRLKLARGAWLDLKKTGRPPISELWHRYKQAKLQDMTLANIESDHNLLVTAQDIFLSGVTLAMHMFEKTINDAEFT